MPRQVRTRIRKTHQLNLTSRHAPQSCPVTNQRRVDLHGTRSKMFQRIDSLSLGTTRNANNNFLPTGKQSENASNNAPTDNANKHSPLVNDAPTAAPTATTQERPTTTATNPCNGYAATATISRPLKSSSANRSSIKHDSCTQCSAASTSANA